MHNKVLRRTATPLLSIAASEVGRYTSKEESCLKENIKKMFYKLALKTLENINNNISLSFRDDFPEINELSVIDLEAFLLPITSSIPKVGQTASTTEEIVLEIQKKYQYQAWRQPYQVDDFGNDFFSKSAWFPIADVHGPVIYSKGLIEIMLLDSGLAYPSHKHSPEELYIILAGKVWWEAENETACWKHAGEVIHHPSNVIHSVKAADKPVLILNLWRGGSFEMPVITSN